MGFEDDEAGSRGFAVFTCEPVSLESSSTSSSSASKTSTTPTSLALLFRTRVNALVLASQPNVVALHDGSSFSTSSSSSPSSSSRSTLLGELSFPASTKVLAVRLRRDAVAVSLSNGRAAAYSLDSLRLLRSVETGPNALGLLSLVAGGSRTIFACPSAVVEEGEQEEKQQRRRGLGGLLTSFRKTRGAVRVEFVDAGRSVFIRAAKHQIAALALSQSAELLATASERGTLVRVFGLGEESSASSSPSSPSASSSSSSSSGTALTPCLRELRRGGEPARMLSLAFSPSVSVAVAAAAATSSSSTATVAMATTAEEGRRQQQRPQWLAAASDRGTVHVWSLLPRSLPPASPQPPATAAASRRLLVPSQQLLAAAAAAAGAPSPSSLAAERSSFHFKLPACDEKRQQESGKEMLAELSFSPGGKAVFAASATTCGEGGRCGLVAVALPGPSEEAGDGRGEELPSSSSPSSAAGLLCVPNLLELLPR